MFVYVSWYLYVCMWIQSRPRTPILQTLRSLFCFTFHFIKRACRPEVVLIFDGGSKLHGRDAKTPLLHSLMKGKKKSFSLVFIIIPITDSLLAKCKSLCGLTLLFFSLFFYPYSTTKEMRKRMKQMPLCCHGRHPTVIQTCNNVAQYGLLVRLYHGLYFSSSFCSFFFSLSTYGRKWIPADPRVSAFANADQQPIAAVALSTPNWFGNYFCVHQGIPPPLFLSSFFDVARGRSVLLLFHVYHSRFCFCFSRLFT